jgi:hypothetical protein
MGCKERKFADSDDATLEQAAISTRKGTAAALGAGTPFSRNPEQ